MRRRTTLLIGTLKDCDACCWILRAKLTKVVFFSLCFPSVFQLNETLSVHGLPARLPAAGEAAEAYHQVVNVVHALLKNHRSVAAARDETAEHIRRLELDRSSLVEQVETLTVRVDKAQRETEHVRGKMAAAETAARKAQLKMEKERDELQKAFVQLQHRDAQYKADLKKKELLTVKLQDQLSRAFSERTRAAKAGMAMLNSLAKTKDAAGKDKESVEFRRKVVQAYEARQKELVDENTGLKASLQLLQGELLNVLSVAEVREQEAGGRRLVVDNTDLGGEDAEQGFLATGGELDAPYTARKQREVEGRMRERMHELAERMASVNRQKDAEMAEEGNGEADGEADGELAAQLAECRRIMAEQQEILDSRLFATMDDDLPPPRFAMGGDDDDAGVDEAERVLFEEQKQQMEKERQQLTDGLVELGRKRAAFERERLAWSNGDATTPSSKRARMDAASPAVRRTVGLATPTRTPRRAAAARLESGSVLSPFNGRSGAAARVLNKHSVEEQAVGSENSMEEV